jgi:protein-S-isoprenylcysteine O-methyltransferase Ste14
MMLMGVFLFTEVGATGIAALLDFFIIITIVIPLEERELLMRFGKEYEEYRQRVRSRFFPRP